MNLEFRVFESSQVFLLFLVFFFTTWFRSAAAYLLLGPSTREKKTEKLELYINLNQTTTFQISRYITSSFELITDSERAENFC